MVSIAGLNKVELLRRLWKSASESAFNTGSDEFDDRAAEKIVKEYVDIFCGRNIHCFLNRDSVDPTAYEQALSPGTFSRIVDKMKKNVEGGEFLVCPKGDHRYKKRVIRLLGIEMCKNCNQLKGVHTVMGY